MPFRHLLSLISSFPSRPWSGVHHCLLSTGEQCERPGLQARSKLYLLSRQGHITHLRSRSPHERSSFLLSSSRSRLRYIGPSAFSGISVENWDEEMNYVLIERPSGLVWPPIIWENKNLCFCLLELKYLKYSLGRCHIYNWYHNLY